MDKVLTVIVAVYNVEKYIRKCLDSLIVSEELMQKVEVLVINDGTPDNSAKIAREYEKKYPESFKVIDKENGGPGSAWNLGVKVATGKYIRFLDSDDWLVNTQMFINKLEDYDVDIVFTDWYDYFVQNDNLVLHSLMSVMVPDIIFKVKEYDWSRTNNLYISNALTNFHRCTYRTTILQEHKNIFIERQMYADMPLYVLPLCCSETFVYFEFPLYCYLHGREEQSIDRKKVVKNYISLIASNKHTVMLYRSLPVCNDNVNNKIINIIDRTTTEHLKILKYLSYNSFYNQMNSFILWLREFFPEYKGDFYIKAFLISPVICWILYHYIQPITHPLIKYIRSLFLFVRK